MEKNSIAGFMPTSGDVTPAIIVQHTSQDEGKTFKDRFGRCYEHTKEGNVYHDLKNMTNCE